MGSGQLVEMRTADAPGRLRATLDAAVARGDEVIGRLARADVTVSLRLGSSQAVTLLLDRMPIEVVPGEAAEVELEVPDRLVDPFLRGRLHMTAAIVGGDVTYTGPVRKYLEVDPILSDLLARHGGAPASNGDGRRVPVSRPPDGERPAADLLAIETRGLRKRFGSNAVLRGLDITIPEGVISVILGPSGTGKSVLLQHIIGLMRPDGGDVLIRGRPLSVMSRSEIIALRRGIGVMFQDGALFSAMTVFDNVAFPLRQHTDLSESEVHEVVMHHLAAVGLADAAQKMPNELSGGMKKRAGLARALVLQPRIVLCDEPDSGLDPVRTALLGELLVAEHARYGGTMVVVTHNVMLARLLADHVAVVWRGQVVEQGLAEHVFDSETPFVRQFLRGEVEGPLGMDA